MSAIILNGKSLASDFESEIKKETEQLISKGITPTLATILVGLDPASATYVKMKQSTCQRLGMKSIAVELDENCLLYTSPSPRDQRGSRMPSSA